MRNTHACKMMTAKELLDFLAFSKLIYCNKLVLPECINCSKMEKMGISSQDMDLIQGKSRFMHCACDPTVISMCDAIRKLDLEISLQNQPDCFL